MPDIFVPQDTAGMTSYYRMAASRGLIIRYTLDYTDKNRQQLKEYNTPEKLAEYLSRQNLLQQFAAYAEQKGLKRRNILMYKSRKSSRKASTATSSITCWESKLHLLPQPHRHHGTESP